MYTGAAVCANNNITSRGLRRDTYECTAVSFWLVLEVKVTAAYSAVRNSSSYYVTADRAASSFL